MYRCNNCDATFFYDEIRSIVTDYTDDMYDRGPVPLYSQACPRCSCDDIEEFDEEAELA